MGTNFCAYCGAAVSANDKFCASCGRPITPAAQQQTASSQQPGFRYHTEFRRSGYSENDVLNQVNAWLAAHPNAANIQCRIDMGTHLGLLTNHAVVNRVMLSYELLDGTNSMEYHLAPHSWFGLYKKDSNRVLDKWREQHPGATVLAAPGMVCQRGRGNTVFFGGIGANNEVKMYIFYKQPRSRASMPQPYAG